MTVDNILQGININKTYNFSSKIVDNFYSDFTRLNDYLSINLLKKKKIIVTFSNKQKLENISKFLTVNYVITDLSKIYSDNVNLVVMDLDQGFEFEDYIVITENEVFKTRDKNVNYSRSRKPGKGI